MTSRNSISRRAGAEGDPSPAPARSEHCGKPGSHRDKPDSRHDRRSLVVLNGVLNAPGDAFESVHDGIHRRIADLTEALDASLSAGAAKTAFIAELSHELRTSVNAIIGFTELMKVEAFGPLGSPKYRQYVGDMHVTAQHLVKLIDDALDMSKQESSRVDLRETDVNLAELVNASLRQITPLACLKAIIVDDRDARDRHGVYCDPLRVQQIFLNLLTNAVKFTPVGGRVTVSTRIMSNGAIALSVADTGEGIAPQDLDRIMQPFQQCENRRRGKREGVGLGLPLSASLARLHGGEITLRSREGEGTVATLTLPAERLISRAPEVRLEPA